MTAMDKEQPPSEPNQSLIRRLLQFSRLSPQPDTSEDLEQEIQELIDEGEEQGLISSHEGQMISSILEFRDTLIREIMTPATDIVSAPLSATPCDIIKLIKTKGFSRIPIYDSSPDNIVGFLHAKQLLTCSAETPLPPLRELLNPPFFVRENDKIVSLLLEFQTRKRHMAIVTDEFGSIRGLVTLEDILEEIVGEIADETDMQVEEWQVLDDDTVITSAKVDIEKIETFFDLEFPEGLYESVGGFIISQLARIPESGEKVEFGPLTFIVLTASKRRIKSVKINRKNK
ncbi:MAG: HlyC/CorC family transporter [Deltaproteobacteria bacterium]|nr:HlyC/CorC family transporter [Deltaproteobacteria bacterium]